MKALIARWRAPRTLGSTVLRLVVPRALLFVSAAAVLLIGNVMAMNPSAARLAPVQVQPVWTAAEQAAQPGCVPSAQWPEGTPGSAVVVHRFSDGATVRMPFMTAWRANHDDTEVDDLWVLGVCP
ncbi:MAG: hypothetical protein ACJ72E_05430 [Marmoricola sp.]